MEVFNVILLFLILKGCAGDFYINVTQKGCLSFDGLSPMGKTVEIRKLKTQVFESTKTGEGEYIEMFGNFNGRIKDLTINRPRGSLFFCIAHTTKDDGGKYKYTGTDNKMTFRKLYVLDKPKKPTLIVKTDGVINVQKGEVLCQSFSTSSPQGLHMSYSWTVNDSVVTGIGKYKFDGSFDSKLIIDVDRNDTFNTYRCFAKEERGQMSGKSNSVQIDPKRKPRIILLPNEETYSILINQNLTIECVTLDAYPNVSLFRWKKDNNPSEQSGKYFTIDNVRYSDTANYECVASNDVSNGTANINVDVLYGPIITVMAEFSQVDGGKINQTCVVQSNPPALDGNVTWTKQDNSTFIQSGIQLIINHVNRNDQGTFICSVNLTLQLSTGSSLKRSDSQTIQLNVLYGPIVTLISSYKQVQGRGIIIRCNVQSYPTVTPANVIWKKQGNATFSQQSLQLNIPSANTKDIGVFLCTATISFQPSVGPIMVRSDVKNVTINVLYGPTIIPMRTYDQFVGKSINKTCVIESNPAATDDTVIWTKHENSSFRQNGLQLFLPHVSVADQGTFVCTVNLILQPTNGSSLMKSDNETISINVLYGPAISPMTTYSQIVGDGIYKTCVIDSNPPASNRDVIWTKHGNSSFMQNSLQLSLSSLNRKDNGTFECTVNISFRTTDGPFEWRTDSQPFDINVLYGPEITPMTNFSQEDGHPIIKACDVVSNPPATDDDVTWTKIGNSSFSQNNLQLNIPALNRLDQGTFNCTVSIILIPTDGRSVHRSATENLEINVLFGPTIVPMTTYSPEEGDNLTIHCMVQSNPPAKNNDVTWTKQSNSSFRQNGLQLSLLPVDKRDHGSFVCSVSITLEPTNQINVERTDTEAVIINVLYKPIVSISGGNVVYEGNTTTAFCIVNSNPLSDITWTYLPSNTYVLESNNISYSEYNISSQLMFAPAQCDNTGPYRCQASNNIQSPATKTITIEVRCKPRLSSLEKKVENITIGRNESLNHTIEFHAVPVPMCSLRFNKTVVSNFKVDVITHDLPYKSGCRIEKNEIMEADVGPYEITVNNSVGQSVVTFYIIFQREPDPPLLHAIDCTGQSGVATIQWKPRWNGGLEQSFFVQYKQIKDLNFKNGEKFIDDGVKEMYTDIIYKLIPGTDYIFKVSASNDKGLAETHQVNCTAVGKDDPETNTLIVIGATTGSLLGFFIIIFVLSVFVVFFKRRTKSQRGDREMIKRCSRTTNEDEEGLKDNPLYVTSGEVSNEHIGPVYGIVNKQKQNKEGLKDNPLYVTSGEVSNGDVGPVYGIVNKQKQNEDTLLSDEENDQGPVYSQVQKSNIKGKKKQKKKQLNKASMNENNTDIELGTVYENSEKLFKQTNSDEIYANAAEHDDGANSSKAYSSRKNKYGLIYADVDLLPGPSGKRFVIRGLENRTNYAIIDLSKKAEPLPSDNGDEDEDKNYANVEPYNNECKG